MAFVFDMKIVMVNIRLRSQLLSPTRKVPGRSSFSHLEVQMKKFNDDKHFEKALILFDEYEEKHGAVLSDRVLTQALKACGKLTDIKRGLALSERIASRPMKDSHTLSSLIHMFSK